MDKIDKNPYDMLQKEEKTRTLELIVDDIRSQIHFDVVNLFVVVEPPSVQYTDVGY